jgi:hypothetical protein
MKLGTHPERRAAVRQAERKALAGMAPAEERRYLRKL